MKPSIMTRTILDTRQLVQFTIRLWGCVLIFLAVSYGCLILLPLEMSLYGHPEIVATSSWLFSYSIRMAFVYLVASIILLFFYHPKKALYWSLVVFDHLLLLPSLFEDLPGFYYAPVLISVCLWTGLWLYDPREMMNVEQGDSVTNTHR